MTHQGHAKPRVDGTGSYTDEMGRPSISSNVLVRNWRGGSSVWFLTIFALFWNFMLGIALTATGPIKVNGQQFDSFQHAYRADPSVLIFLLFPLVGFGMAYVAACMWINTTRISCLPNSIVRKRGPLPWPGRKLTIEVGNISQLYVQKYSSHSQNDRPVIAFRVMVQMKSGPQIVLDSGMTNYQDARILEQWIESRTGIEDVFVPGEVG